VCSPASLIQVLELYKNGVEALASLLAKIFTLEKQHASKLLKHSNSRLGKMIYHLFICGVCLASILPFSEGQK